MHLYTRSSFHWSGPLGPQAQRTLNLSSFSSGILFLLYSLFTQAAISDSSLDICPHHSFPSFSFFFCLDCSSQSRHLSTVSVVLSVTSTCASSTPKIIDGQAGGSPHLHLPCGLLMPPHSVPVLSICQSPAQPLFESSSFDGTRPCSGGWCSPPSHLARPPICILPPGSCLLRCLFPG